MIIILYLSYFSIVFVCFEHQETVNNLNLHIKANALELKDTSAGMNILL